jgi:3-hydroxyisobutyrate dehydrogenase-like beta-hydroxyacid dehydrogenase
MTDMNSEAAQEMPAKDKPTVGFVGLGSQGGPMARRIVEAGFPLLLWARRPETLTSFADTAAGTARDLADLGARSDIVAVCVVDDAGVQQVVDAMLPAMRRGTHLVIHSTIHPDTCKALAEQAAARGVAFIDAPVSGGGGGAAAGTLTVMAGGDKEAVERVWPVFKTFGGMIVYLGGVGSGQLAKLVNNSLMAANMALADAALAAGATLGIDRAAFIELVKASSGRSFGFDVRARMPHIAAFGHGAKLLAKDVGLLAAVIPDDKGCVTLRSTAEPFLERIAQMQG